MRIQRDPYLVLGISPTSGADEIRKRFRFLSQAFHPDKFFNSEYRHLAEEEFKRINAAHRILSNPEQREQFDSSQRNHRSERQDSPAKSGSVDPAGERGHQLTRNDCYAILNVHPKATLRDVTRQYQFLTHAFQPERFASEEHRWQAGEQLKLIDKALQALSALTQPICAESRVRPRSVPYRKPHHTASGQRSWKKALGRIHPIWLVLTAMGAVVVLGFIAVLLDRMGAGVLAGFAGLSCFLYPAFLNWLGRICYRTPRRD